ncbi:MAG: methylated-DNA--[protein]-cysteine S-methyltransferase [Verrucomicrobiota bacterium]|jgi:O-6-methylguanine DNA methyltransferase
MKNQLFPLSISTTDGQFIARYSARGLAALSFPKVGSARCADRTSQRDVPTSKIPAQILRWHRATAAGLKSSLAGRKPKNLPPLDLAGGTAFQRNVWRALRKIQRGRTRSYGEIAQQIGKPRAVRAVGGACGANPVPVFVPCHRVLAANKKLGGFSGGLDWKRNLLAREGIVL